MFGLPKLKILSLFGIDLYFDASFFFLLGIFLFRPLEALAIMLMVFSFVILHEFGHALTAKKLGYETKDITIGFVGGIASIEGDWIKNPTHELIITFAGPMVNFVLMALSSLTILLPFNSTIDYVASLTFVLNAIILAFNLLPIYPMDGGRMLKSILLILINKSTAFKWTQYVSIAVAVSISIAFLSIGAILPAAVLLLMAFLIGPNELGRIEDELSGN